jgi:hypothetical protein
MTNFTHSSSIAVLGAYVINVLISDPMAISVLLLCSYMPFKNCAN